MGSSLPLAAPRWGGGGETLTCCLFDNSHYDRCEGISHCGFNLHFPDD